MNHGEAQRNSQSLGIGDLLIDHKGLPMFLTQKATHKRFEYSGGSSHKFKFWEIEVDDNSFTVNYGRIGSAGTKQTKRWASKARCKHESDMKVNEKLKKGYKEIKKGFMYHFDNPCGKPSTLTMHENDIIEGLTRKGWTIQRKKKAS